MSKILFSVVIPTRNRASQLKRMLDTLLQDEYHYKEIIVCDGASTDGTVDLLKSYGGQVRWISEPDKGEYEARNKGLRLATGQIIKYMSDDDVLLPGSFLYAVQYFNDHPHVDIIFGQSIWFDERGGQEPRIYDTRMRNKESITLRNFIRGSKPLVNSETAFFRRRVIARIGFFDTTLHGADYDYWARAAKAGLKIAICDKVFVHYYLSDFMGVECKYSKLVFEHWKLAYRHGDWADKLYVGFYYIHYHLLVRGFINYLPLLAIPIRNFLARRKSRRQPYSIE